jgi:Fic family protein
MNVTKRLPTDIIDTDAIKTALTNLLLLQNGYSYTPYVSLEEIIEDKKIEYYQALRVTQKNHRTNKEDIGPWLNFMLDALIVQMEKARKLMKSEDPMKLLSKNQKKLYDLFENANELSVMEIDKILNGTIPLQTLKQALARLVHLDLLERIGAGRGSRYKKIN